MCAALVICFQQVKYCRNDRMSFSRSGYKKTHSPRDCACSISGVTHSGGGDLSRCKDIQACMERSIWLGTKTCHQSRMWTWKQILLQPRLWTTAALATTLNTTWWETLSQDHPGKPFPSSWSTEMFEIMSVALTAKLQGLFVNTAISN